MKPEDQTLDDQTIETAIAWHLASDSDAMDWDAFTSWLEADVRNQAVYDAIARTDSIILRNREALREANRPPSLNIERNVRRPRLAWFGGAIAASLALAAGFWTISASRQQIYETQANPRSITLADGSRIVVAPHSRLVIEGRGEGLIALEGGAWFDIRHDPEHTLTITAGGARISDIGTRFDVQSSGSDVRIGVAEGQVGLDAPGMAKPLTLSRGQTATLDGVNATLAVGDADPNSVGSWRSGRLSYEDVPLALVASDLRRYAGVTVEYPAALGDRRFSGTLVVRDGKAALRDLAQLMGLELNSGGDGYNLRAPGP